MPIITGTNVDITGTQASGLAAKLKWFKDTEPTTAGGLITIASNNNLTIEVKDGTGHCKAISKSQVELDWVECKRDIKQLAETALFEMNNAANFADYNKANKEFNNNKYSILKYGYEMATRESNSSVALNKVLVTLGSSYSPSDFGKGHMRKNREAALSTTTTLEKIFANTKQEATATTGHPSLKSKHLYSCEAIKRLGTNFNSAGGKIKKITTIIKPPVKARVDLNSSEYREHILKYFSNRYTSTPKDYVALQKLVVSYILALQKLQVTHGWTITWNGNGAEWLNYANEVVRVDSIVVGGVPDEIANKFIAKFG